MDVIYQYYLKFLMGMGLPEWSVVLFWQVGLFIVACFACVIFAVILKFIGKKIFCFLNGEKFAEISQSYDGGEDFSFRFANQGIFNLVPIIFLIPNFLVWGLIPYSNKYIPVVSDVSLLLFFILILLVFMAILVGCYLSKNKMIIGAAIRTAVVLFSFLIPMFLAVMSVVVLASSLNLNDIILAQSQKLGFWGWFLLPDFIAFWAFISGIVVLSSFLLSGLVDLRFSIFSLCSPMTLKLVNITKYVSVFTLSIFVVCLFVGGYLPPFGFYLSELCQINYVLNTSAVYIEQIFWLLFKSMLLSIALIFVSPYVSVIRGRKLTDFAFRVLLPFSVLNFIIICIVKTFLGSV